MPINVQKINQLLGTIEKCVDTIKHELNGTTSQATVSVSFGGRPATRTQVTQQERRISEVEKLIQTPEWPEAVPQDLLCSVENNEEKISRAEAILDMTIDCDLRGKRFLDFGCGNGYVAFAAKDRGVSESVGFDIVNHRWDYESFPNLSYQVDIRNLQGEFDVIMLYDVLDHAEVPIQVLTDCKRLLAPGGVIYIRCHPWCSRHGGHMYRTLNKAYANVVIPDGSPLWFSGSSSVMEFPVKKLLDPLKSYQDWQSVTGLKTRVSRIQKNNPESFFLENDIAKSAILRHWERSDLTEKQIFEILGIEFVDYVVQVA